MFKQLSAIRRVVIHAQSTIRLTASCAFSHARAISALRSPVLFLHGFVVAFFCFGFVSQPSIAVETEREVSADKGKLGTLQLLGGDVYRGRMDDGAGLKSDAYEGSLVWNCPAFGSNLIIPWNKVERISQPLDAKSAFGDTAPSTDEEFIFQSFLGECISGKLLNLDSDFVELESPLAGKKKLPISELQSILRIIPPSIEKGGGSVPMDGWKQIVPAIKQGGRSKWFEQTGALVTETTGTTIAQSVQMPELSAIDIEVGWEQPSPNWTLTIGAPRRFELHFRKMEARPMISVSILVDDETVADVDTAQFPSEGLNSISLRVLCDPTRGRFVLVHGGRTIAQLKIARPMRLSGTQELAFTNIGSGRISLRDLRISQSIFSVPIGQSGSKRAKEKDLAVETMLHGGETRRGKPIQFDPLTRTFAIDNANTNQSRIAVEQVDRIEFPPTSDDVPQSDIPMFIADLQSGARYVGQTIRLESGDLLLSIENLQSRVRIPIKSVRSIGLTGIQNRKENPESDSSVSWMKLVSPWALSTGTMEGVSRAEAENPRTMSSLYWKPKIANKVPFAPDLTGSIEPVYTAAPQVSAPKSPYSVVVPPTTRTLEARALKEDEPSLFLANGDCFPANVKFVNETQTHFSSKHFENGVVTNGSIRGVRILVFDNQEPIDIGAKKRLLTLPRAQRTNPPTHLIISRRGDAIRGHLKSLTEDDATIEVRGSDRKVLMKTVAEIIWLPEPPPVTPPGKDPTSSLLSNKNLSSKESIATIDSSETKAPAVDYPSNELRCVALFGSGSRITMRPKYTEGDRLVGVHDELGKCYVDLTRVIKLVLGTSTESDAERNWYSRWKLENAPDPKFVNDLDSPEGDGNSGELEPGHAKLVGESAPEFTLQKMDGPMIQLSDLKGRIVVLDFWATWCGPCIASLPRINDIGQEYKGAGVELVTVNIEQKPAEIKAVLNRLEINPTVVLDSSGSVARAYKALSIPQTVIIDRDGKVAHIFVGGGDSTEKRVREALNGMIDSKK